MLSEKEVFDLLLNESGLGLLNPKHFDDAAVLSFSGINMAISTDFIRGTQFNVYEAGYLSFADLAHYLVAANASDIASMGVAPSGFLNIFRYPLKTDKKLQSAFFSGLKDASQHYNVEIVGGDSGSYSEFVMGGTCFGFTKKSELLYRKNAQVGDLIFVSGQPGRCRAAQIALLEPSPNHYSESEIEFLLGAWKKPNPPLELGPFLVAEGLSVCGQDTSDGLGETIATICRESGVGAQINQDKLPKHEVVERVANMSKRKVEDLVLSISPDFQLLFTLPKEKLSEFEKNKHSTDVHCIGEIIERRELILTGSSGTKNIQLEGWNQANSFKV